MYLDGVDNLDWYSHASLRILNTHCKPHDRSQTSKKNKLFRNLLKKIPKKKKAVVDFSSTHTYKFSLNKRLICLMKYLCISVKIRFLSNKIYDKQKKVDLVLEND
jgi:hypothetical protein